jgi:LuxR family maltose regulon positive regulatory protein
VPPDRPSFDRAELPVTVVDRPRLVARVELGATGRVTLVVGPSGSGKSVLLRQWAAAHAARSPAWVVVDEASSDAVSFARQLVGALAVGRPGFGAEARRHVELGGQRMGRPFLEALTAELARGPATTLVVEDLHHLPEAVVGELTQLAAQAPSHVHLVVASRVRPDLSLAGLRASGQLVELGAEDLAFDDGEVAAVIHQVAGLDLRADLIRRVQGRTEGWAVGVQLVAMAVRDAAARGRAGAAGERAAVAEQLARFDGAGREVAEYLAEEVVAGQPDAVRRFLRRTCVLDRLEASLCDALTGDADGQDLLDELGRRNLFLLPEGDAGWYRYHPLFAEMLRADLRGHDRQLHDDLLVRGATWHLDRGELAPGVELLLRAERWEQALDLIGANGWTFFERGDAATAIRWLEGVPVAERWRHGQAQLTLASLHRSVGNAAIADLILDEVARRNRPGNFTWVSMEVMRAGGIGWDRDPAAALADARSALDWLEAPPDEDGRRPSEPGNDWAIGPARLAGGLALTHLGRWGEAREWLERAPGIAAEYPPWLIRTLGATAQLEAIVGRLDRAEAAGRRALALEADIAPLDPTAAALAYQALGRVAYERGRLVEAAELLDEAELRSRVYRSAVEVAAVTGEQARLHLASGDHAGGLELLARWRREGEPTPPADVLGRIAAVEVQLLLALGDAHQARRTLAAAPQQGETLAVAAEVAAAAGDAALLDAVLARWAPSPRVREQIERLLWEALAADAAGHGERSQERLSAAARLAAVDGHRQVFVDGGPELAALAGAGTLPEGEGPPELSAREQEVLAHLDSRLTNPEIAAELGISTNTLKTHLRRLYRKLGVADRRGALARAGALGVTTAPRRRRR